MRARLIRPKDGQSILDFPWSSLSGGYALPPGKRAKWLGTAAGLAAAGVPDTAAGRRQFVERLDRRAALRSNAFSGARLGFAHFPDREHGGGFGCLHRAVTVSQHAKGNMFKGRFHLARKLWFCARELTETGQPPG